MTIENYITIQEVLRIMHCSRTKIYYLMRDGQFPQGSKLGKSRVWRERDVRRVAEALQPSEKEIKAIISNASGI